MKLHQLERGMMRKMGMMGLAFEQLKGLDKSGGSEGMFRGALLPNSNFQSKGTQNVTFQVGIPLKGPLKKDRNPFIKRAFKKGRDPLKKGLTVTREARGKHV